MSVESHLRTWINRFNRFNDILYPAVCAMIDGHWGHHLKVFRVHRVMLAKSAKATVQPFEWRGAGWLQTNS